MSEGTGGGAGKGRRERRGKGWVGTPEMFLSPGEVQVWKRFREAGALEPASLEKKEREALADRVTKLEAEGSGGGLEGYANTSFHHYLSNSQLTIYISQDFLLLFTVLRSCSSLLNELYDYQHNMGLLLIEKKNWIAKFEDLKQALMETEENLKREQAAHLIALSEAEKREEACRKALGVEKQCVADMEKALHEMHVESAEVKFTSDKKLAEAQALVAGVEEKSMEAEAKIYSAEARLAEASRKLSKAERKLQEVDARESTIKKERASLTAEREAHEEAFSRENVYLRDWDKELQDRQERLVEGQRLLIQREVKGKVGGAGVWGIPYTMIARTQFSRLLHPGSGGADPSRLATEVVDPVDQYRLAFVVSLPLPYYVLVPGLASSSYRSLESSSCRSLSHLPSAVAPSTASHVLLLPAAMLLLHSPASNPW
ncbi:CROWDED NUCLEI 1 protein [Nymphaea thermarum]|nr:CROWDED NUCLEI 1 protein [Nymphaea thermarum]